MRPSCVPKAGSIRSRSNTRRTPPRRSKSRCVLRWSDWPQVRPATRWSSCPGPAEIRRAQNACAALARRHGWLIAPLYGDQTPEEQDLAVAPSPRRKIVLATNVAESSITIEGVNTVIDSGLARVAGHSPWSGLPTLEVARISQASANQRAGRAGRTGPGRAIRLYPMEDFVRRAGARRSRDSARRSRPGSAAAARHGDRWFRCARMAGCPACRRRRASGEPVAATGS